MVGSSISIQEKKRPWTNLSYTQIGIDDLMRIAFTLPKGDNLRVYLLDSVSSIQKRLDGPFFKFPFESSDCSGVNSIRILPFLREFANGNGRVGLLMSGFPMIT